VNGSAGFTFNTGKFTATVDGYYIKCKKQNCSNRKFLQKRFASSDVQTDYPYIDQAQFFPMP
jgi:iron complex outermembrane receptor protein